MTTPGSAGPKAETPSHIYRWILGRQTVAEEIWAHVAILRQALEQITPAAVDEAAPGCSTWGNASSAALVVVGRIEAMAADHVSKLDPQLIESEMAVTGGGSR